jgi:hypothetical protein
LANIEFALPSIVVASAALNTAAATNGTAIDQKTAAFNAKVQQFELDNSNAILEQESDQLSVELSQLFVASEALRTQFGNDRAAVATVLRNQNNAIIPTNLFETNLKTALDLYLKTIGQGQLATATEINWLETMGNSCFENAGPAVFYARSLYGSLTKTSLPTTICANSLFVGNRNSDELARKEQSNGLSIVPNPASDNITIAWPATIEPVELSIFNLTGQLILRQKMDTKSTNEMVDLNAFSNGVYFVRLRCHADCDLTQKLIISH